MVDLREVIDREEPVYHDPVLLAEGLLIACLLSGWALKEIGLYVLAIED
jgi:hypothetical protein